MIIIGGGVPSGSASAFADWVELIKALVWPLTVLVVLLIFRAPIAKRIGKLSSLKWGDKEARFGDKLDEIEETISSARPNALERAIASDQFNVTRATQEASEEPAMDGPPEYQILHSWHDVERALMDLAVNQGIPLAERTPKNIKTLASKLSLPAEDVISITEMRELRNRVVHRDFAVSETDALRYGDLAKKLAANIRSRRVPKLLDPVEKQ